VTGRRELLVALGAGALVSPFSSFAQPAKKIWRIGFLSASGRPASIDTDVFLSGLLRGLRELGYAEGKNLAIEWRFAHGQPELLAPLAAELVKLNVDVVVAQGSPATFAMQKATSTIPIVFVGPGDPVGYGLVKSLARPEGNTTGLSSMTRELGPKRLEMLLAMTSTASTKVSRVAMLVNPNTRANIISFDGTLTAGKKLGVEARRADAKSPQDIDNAFAAMKRDKFGALIVSLDTLFQQQRNQIAELSMKLRLPCMAADRAYTEAGCLMSYGSSQTDLLHRAATYADKIFKGAKAADLPVEQPTKLDLFINGKTAKALGLKIPYSLQIMVDKVIE
jgi:putative ABC transport system substrate-binding protein